MARRKQGRAWHEPNHSGHLDEKAEKPEVKGDAGAKAALGHAAVLIRVVEPVEPTPVVRRGCYQW
jgi:hypothetical protein